MTTPLTVELEQLIARWRESAAWEVESGDRQYGTGLDQCADELEDVVNRALHQHEPVKVADVAAEHVAILKRIGAAPEVIAIAEQVARDRQKDTA